VNKNYLREDDFHYYDEETPMTQQAIDRDFDYRAMKARTKQIIVTVLFLALIAAFCATAAYAQAARTATITFTAPTTRTDGSTITGALSYEVWQGLKGGTKAKASTVNATSTTINITTGLQGGREYCWHIVAVEAGVASAPSNEACKAFEQSPPNTVTITVT
jgi:hypothetical protein